MIFLGVLAVATIVAAVIRRSDWRGIARWGMGIAMIVAGLAHLARPTPFEQHLPEWVPAIEALVAATGVVEIVLGVALLAARGRPGSRTRRVTGRLTAAYLVGVFPANLYVAVAGVHVDGQPGGAYPWLRLPLQGLFVAWALWSTADPRQPSERIAKPDLPYLRLPRVHGPVEQPDKLASDDGTCVVMASRLELRRLRDVPAFLSASLKLRRLFRRTPGAIAMSLAAAPLERTFWTLSAWETHDALRAYAAHEAHDEVMRRFRPAMKAAVFVDWPTSAPGLPTWQQARQQVAAQAARPAEGGSSSRRSGRATPSRIRISAGKTRT